MKAKVEADALKSKEEAAKAEAERAQKAAADLRAQLLEQFNRIWKPAIRREGSSSTWETSSLTSENMTYGQSKGKLAKLSGIILGHPGLNLAVEGHTDNVVAMR